MHCAPISGIIIDVQINFIRRNLLKAKLLRLLVVMTISIMALFALGITAGAATAGDFIITLTDGGDPAVDSDYIYADGVLTIKSETAMTIANADPNTATTDSIEVADGVSANITLSGVNIDLSDTGDCMGMIPGKVAFMIADNSTGNVTIILDGTNTLKSGVSWAGLQKNGEYISETRGKLTITGTGSLTAIGGDSGAGIGGGSQSNGSNITISGGTINAQSGVDAAGIGGGYEGSGSYITISGGTVSASNDSGGAGIGGGNRGSGSNIIISGGTVTAKGGNYGAGIGGGSHCGGSDIIIDGGSVKVVAGSFANAIGGGYDQVALVPTDGTNDVYLLTIANPDSKTVYIDSAEYAPVNHTAADSTDTNLYVYLTGEDHTVKVGSEVKYYTYNSTTGAFEINEVDDLVVTGTDLVYGTDYTYADGVLTVKSETAITIANTDPNTATTDSIEVADGVSANITLAGVNIDVSSQNDKAAFKIADNSTGDVTITLADSTTNTLKSGGLCAGLQKNGTNGSLVISGTGTLNTIGGGHGAGIGGGHGGAAANIEISGGTVIAQGGDLGPGIGGGSYVNGTNITISGGTVTAAHGGYTDVDIGGGGQGGSSSGIIISGGSVKANNIDSAPTNGTNNVYLLTIANPNGKAVNIDGADYTPVNHTAADSTDTNLYVYLTGEDHTVKVGNEVEYYTYNSTTGAIEIKQGSDFVVTGADLVYGEDYTYPASTGVLTILSEKAITIANTDPNTATTTDSIEVADGVSANITLAGVNIDVSWHYGKCAFTIADNSTGDVTITLADGTMNTLVSADRRAALQKNGEYTEELGTLTIKGGIAGTGILNATGGGMYAAGIGGGEGESGSNIEISGGIVNAQGGDWGAGIGGGIGYADGGRGTNITISGGIVTATGGNYGDGIGGDNGGSDITISGGSVKVSSICCTPTDGNGNNVYLLELTSATTSLKIDDKDYPIVHGTDGKVYVYLTEGEHTIVSDENSAASKYAKNADNKLEAIGAGLIITGTDLVLDTDYTYPADTGVLTILSEKAVTIKNSDPQTPTTDRIEVADAVSANITLAGVNISANGTPFRIADNSKGNVTITLSDGTDNILYANATDNVGLAKISEADSGTLTINGNGKLTATGNWNAAGIGGGNTANIVIESGTIIANGGGSGAGIGSGYQSNAYNITIKGGTVTATGGIRSSRTVNGYIYIGGAGIGAGAGGDSSNIVIIGGTVLAKVQHSDAKPIGKSSSGGTDINPTDGNSNNVYLLTIANPDSKTVYIDGAEYTPVNHTAADSTDTNLYVYLPAKTAADPNVVTIGETTTKYCYDTIYSRWLVVVDAPEADDAEFTYDGKEKTYTLAESDYYTITDNTTQTYAGTYTVVVSLNDGYIWSDGSTDVKSYTFMIKKADLTVTAEDREITAGDALPSDLKYTADGLQGNDTLESIDAGIVIAYADGTTAETAGEYDIVVEGEASTLNYNITYVNGKLTVKAREVVSAPVFTPASGTIFTSTQSVTITCATDGADIYYTTDGTVPTTASTLYEGAITINKTTTINAIAVKDGMTDSAVVTAKYTLKSTVPENVKAKAGYGEATITWDTVDGATKYAVYIYENSKYVCLNSNIKATSYTATGLTNGTKYGFKVKAYVGKWSGASAIAYATPFANIVPQNVKASAGDGQVTVTWDAVDEATKYAVYIYVDGKYTCLNSNIKTTSYTAKGLTNSTKYGFKVKAYVGKWSGASAIAYATPVADDTVPQNVRVVAGNCEATVKWDAVSGATRYAVYSYLDGQYTLLDSNVKATTYTATDLTNGTKYGFKVKAYVGKWSAASKIAYTTPTTSTVPQGVKAVAGNGEVTVKWNEVAGAEKYAVYIYIDGKYTCITSEVTDLSYVVTELKNGTKYGFKVKACVDGKWSAASLISYATPTE